MLSGLVTFTTTTTNRYYTTTTTDGVEMMDGEDEDKLVLRIMMLMIM